MNSKLRIPSTKRAAAATVIACAVLALFSAAAGAQSHTPKTSSSYPADSFSDLVLPTGRDALRRIVQDLCVPNWLRSQSAAPCERLFLADPKSSNSGYAVLAAPGGGAHYLLIPTQTMSGVERSELLDLDAPNYFAEAWQARDLLAKFAGHDVPRIDVGLVVNTAQTRAYSQFHIHIECLRQDVFDALHASAERVTDTWAPLGVGGATYQAMRIMGDGLDGSNLYELLAALGPDTSHHLGDYTLIVAGAQFKGGRGFIVLTGTGLTGELLLDPNCAIAGGGG